MDLKNKSPLDATYELTEELFTDLHKVLVAFLERHDDRSRNMGKGAILYGAALAATQATLTHIAESVNEDPTLAMLSHAGATLALKESDNRIEAAKKAGTKERHCPCFVCEAERRCAAEGNPTPTQAAPELVQ